MDESEFDKLVIYTLRVELLNGQMGDEQKQKLKTLWFETSHRRQVIINCDSIARVTFCYDLLSAAEKSWKLF
jgi:hypothetical protein